MVVTAKAAHAAEIACLVSAAVVAFAIGWVFKRYAGGNRNGRIYHIILDARLGNM